MGYRGPTPVPRLIILMRDFCLMTLAIMYATKDGLLQTIPPSIITYSFPYSSIITYGSKAPGTALDPPVARFMPMSKVPLSCNEKYLL